MATHSKIRIAAMSVTLLLGMACTDDGANADDAQTQDDDTDTTDLDTPIEQAPARGIHITQIELNQGTAITIGQASEWLPIAARSGRLVADRDTIMRVHFSVDEGFVPREIEARLMLEYADGESQTRTEIKLVEESSNPYSLGSPFFFDFAAIRAQAETTYELELWETEPGAGQDMAEGAWRNPSDGPQVIGYEGGAMQIKVVMVPILYTWPDPDTLAPVVEAEQLLIDNLYQQNPVNEVIWDIHEPVEYDEEIQTIAALLPVMNQLRLAEAAEPNVYYHAFVDVGGGGIDGTAGIGLFTADQPDHAGNRIGATVLWSENLPESADTFTHEIGHNQGLSHVACPATDPDSIDGSYPHDNGQLGSWGFGIRNFELYTPTGTYEYMSYCAPSWVSGWSWDKTFQRIETLTAWDFEGATGGDDDDPPASLLMGAIYPNGSSDWWTAPGVIDPSRPTSQERVIFETNEGQVLERWAQVERLHDRGGTRWLATPMPAELDELVRVVHIDTRGAEIITPAEIGL